MTESGSSAALVTFLVYILGVFGLAWLSNKLLRSRSFLSEYFLGSRSLGVWAFALTFAATSASGGSFTGFPSKVYSHGWILALWIGSYMVVPICTMGLLGKRINQVGRISGAITVPDVLRDRFHSVHFGLLATALIVFFMSFNLVAQFKAGSLILETLLGGVGLFHDAAVAVGHLSGGIELLHAVDPEYLLCLLAFGVVVIAYTTYGGFHAVVWTDVVQGIVMGLGVLLMLGLTLYQVGGLEKATGEMTRMSPPQRGTATLTLPQTKEREFVVDAGTWISLPVEESARPRLFRVTRTTVFKPGDRSIFNVDVLEITTPREIDRVLAVKVSSEVILAKPSMVPYRYGAASEQRGAYVRGPGPSQTDPDGFLPFSLAISFFIMWAITGSGQPSGMVRLMAFRNTRTLRRAIFTVTVYYSLIYLPLVIIFCCARILMPGMEAESDRIMPAMAIFLTENIGAGWLGGLLVAAPFAAVMSTVDSFLLMISSALVRDVYQRNINPQISERRIRGMSYLFTSMVGIGAMLGALNPPQFLQDIIVYTGSGLAACFLSPMVFALYWPRANASGCMAGMLAGFLAHLSMYTAGAWMNGSFFLPYKLFNLDPIIVGLVGSFVTVYVVTLQTPPPPKELVQKYFYRNES